MPFSFALQRICGLPQIERIAQTPMRFALSTDWWYRGFNTWNPLSAVHYRSVLLLGIAIPTDGTCQLLESGYEKPRLGEQLELLKGFLESTDFKKLRSEYEPFLFEGKTVTFILDLEAETTKYRMEIL